jgi:hypothetical protein
VLTADKALASEIGVKCREILPYCTDEFMLILWMAMVTYLTLTLTLILTLTPNPNLNP